ncbi:MAG TPA: hypothetical protein VEL82_06090 [Thermoplasmata archaeon]|nr:hypothetical protein [Thermoplasmata archaeon]
MGGSVALRLAGGSGLVTAGLAAAVRSVYVTVVSSGSSTAGNLGPPVTLQFVGLAFDLGWLLAAVCLMTAGAVLVYLAGRAEGRRLGAAPARREVARHDDSLVYLLVAAVLFLWSFSWALASVGLAAGTGVVVSPWGLLGTAAVAAGGAAALFRAGRGGRVAAAHRVRVASRAA